MGQRERERDLCGETTNLVPGSAGGKIEIARSFDKLSTESSWPG